MNEQGRGEEKFSKCRICGQIKKMSSDNFYFRKARNSYETTCIECKKNKQRESRNSSEAIAKNDGEESSNSLPLLVRATEQSFPTPGKSDKDEVFKVFNMLKQWRDELQQQDPEEFKKNWQEVKDVSK